MASRRPSNSDIMVEVKKVGDKVERLEGKLVGDPFKTGEGGVANSAVGRIESLERGQAATQSDVAEIKADVAEIKKKFEPGTPAAQAAEGLRLGKMNKAGMVKLWVTTILTGVALILQAILQGGA